MNDNKPTSRPDGKSVKSPTLYELARQLGEKALETPRSNMFKVEWFQDAAGTEGQDQLAATSIERSQSLQAAIDETIMLWRTPNFLEMERFRIMESGIELYRSPKRWF